MVDAENPDVGDLRLSAGDVVWETDLGQEVAQRLLTRLNFWRGEWFLNTSAGTPYVQAILGIKAVPHSVVRAVFSSVVLGTPGVASLDRLEFTIGTDRRLVLDFVARLTNGQVFRSSDFGPFVVNYAS